MPFISASLWREFSRILLFPALLLLTAPALAQDKPAAVARCENVNGALLQKKATGGWQPVPPKSAVAADQLLVALFQADLISANQTVEIKLLGDVGERGVFPVLESAATLHKSADFDVDLTLERGIVIFSNRKKDAVKIRVRFLKENFDITLPDAKSRLAVEIYGRHVPGPPNLADAKKDVPVTNVFFFALAGEPTVENEEKLVRLQAPPGTALMHWDSATGTSETRHFDRTPEMAKPLTPEEQKRLEKLCSHAQLLMDKANIGALNAAEDVDSRKVTVTALGALDMLPQLMGVMEQSKAADRDQAVLVLRHWLGRGSGHSIKLYKYLTKERQYTPVQAKSFLHLLNGIDSAKLQQPGTYDLLIMGLNHSKLPLRELARWHLVRLVPDGKTIVYDAAGTEPQRLQAIAEWRRLIPEGELPPPPKSKTPNK